MTDRTKKILLTSLFILAVLLRFWQLTASDVITDEASLGFRALGWIDFDASVVQPSPWEKVTMVPAWMKLSMHDHPAGFFLIQNLALRIFSDTVLALRFFSALFGIGVVWLIYRITQKLWGEKTALIAGALATLDTYLLFSSRVGLQESTVLFFMLASLYFFLLAKNKTIFYQLAGVFLGLGLITKYTALILIPLYLTVLLIDRPKSLPIKDLTLGSVWAILIFSPSIFYNIKLFQAFGHFDFQFSYLFGQKVTDWQIQPGKQEFSGLAEKFQFLFYNLWQGWTWPFFILAIGGFMHTLSRWKKDPSTRLVSLSILWWLLFYLLIGPTQRFLVYSAPFFLLALAYTISHVKKESFRLTVLILILFWQGIIFFHSFIPQCIHPSLASSLRSEVSFSGYNELDEWMYSTTAKYSPKLSFEYTYPFLNQAALRFSDQTKKNPMIAYFFVYDEDMNEVATLWIMHRYGIYHGWPIMKSQKYLEIISQAGVNKFFLDGFEKIFVIKKLPVVIGKKYSQPSGNVDQLLGRLKLDQAEPSLIIKNKAGEPAFEIFEVTQ